MVLILVLMDDALGAFAIIINIPLYIVLILVLMDDALGAGWPPQTPPKGGAYFW